MPRAFRGKSVSISVRIEASTSQNQRMWIAVEPMLRATFTYCICGLCRILSPGIPSALTCMHQEIVFSSQAMVSSNASECTPSTFHQSSSPALAASIMVTDDSSVQDPA